MSLKLQKAWQSAVERTLQRRKIHGFMGKRKADDNYIYDVPGEPGFVFVTIRLSNGGQTVVPANNIAAGIKHAPRLAVEMVREDNEYRIIGKSTRRDLSSLRPPDPSGVETHSHGQYLQTSDLYQLEQVALEDTNQFVLLDGGVIKYGLWSTLKTALTTLFDGLYVPLVGDSTIEGLVTIYNAAVTSVFRVTGDGVRGAISVLSYRTNANQSFIQLFSARGSQATPLTSVSGDRVGQIQTLGYSQAAAAFLEVARMDFRVDGTPESGGDTTDMPGRIEISTTPDGASTPVVAMVIDSTQSVAIDSQSPPTGVKHFLFQPTLGNIMSRHQSGSRTDGPFEQTRQNEVSTTNATVTTLHTFAIPANTVVTIEAKVVARRTGGASGTGVSGDGARFTVEADFQNISGTVTQIGATGSNSNKSASAVAWVVDFSISGTDVLLRVTGAASMNVVWHMSMSRISQVST